MENNEKSIGELTVDELFAEVEEYFNYLNKGDEVPPKMFAIMKEIVLRIGPSYEIYEKFTKLYDLLDRMEDTGKVASEFGLRLVEATELWEEIKRWYFD